MRREWYLLGLSICLALLLTSESLAQAFTFQGYLRQNNNPADGTYDFRFRLWNASTGGSQVGSDVFVDDVNVQNGLFTVELNFGNVWDGSPRFLEIAVRPGASTGGYQELAPRVKINPTPYANTATLLNMFQSGTNNPNRMVITHSPPFPDWGLQYRDSDDSFHFIGGGTTALRIGIGDLWTEVPSGAGLRVLGTLRIPSGAAAGRVLTSDASGNATWQPLPSGATVWAVSGNHIYNTNTGNVGIGVSNPSYRLHVETSSGSRAIFGHHTATTGTTYGVYGLSFSIAGTGVYGVADALTGTTYGVRGESNSTSGTGVYGYATASTGTNYGVYGRSDSTSGRGVFGLANAFTGTNYGVYGQTNSPDGYGGYFIGRGYFEYDSTIANATLRLHETASDFARLEFTNTNTARKWHIAGYIGTATGNDASADSIVFWNSATGDLMRLLGNGNLSLGTPPLSPTARLTVSANSTTDNPTLRLHETEADYARLEFTNTNTARKWQITARIGDDHYEDRLHFWNSSEWDILTLTGNGNLGIGTTLPSARLHVRGRSGYRSTAIISAMGGYWQNDWPTTWDGGIATYDICAAGIRYSVLQSRSDERLKRDITPLDAQYELQRLLQLRPVSYFWRDERLHKAVGEQPQFGFIAQELREIFPELVQEGGEDNILAVNYQALIPLLVNAIQLQQREIEQLRAEVQQLRAQLKR